MTSLRNVTANGLWRNNPVLVQILGICPLLAVTNTFINGLGLGMATLLVLIASNITVSMVRKQIPNEIRMIIFVLLIAAFVTNVQLLMNAYTYELYLILGIFVPLIVTNNMIISRAENFACHNKVVPAFVDGLMHGLGFLLVLVVLGGLREILGQGTLFSNAHLLLGDWAKDTTIILFNPDHPFLFALLPPGAFIGLGLLIAAKNYLDNRQQKKNKAAATIESYE